MAAAGPSRIVTPRDNLYCSCGLPPEYCEFGTQASKCRKWLEDTHPAVFGQLYSDAALTANLEALTVQQRDALAKDAAKKEKQAESKAQKAAAKLGSAKVTIRKMERTKRKSTTAIHGLDAFGVDLKAAAKFLGKRFATGASVSKTPQGDEEIVIQGEVADEVEELLLDTTPKVASVLGGGKIPEDNIYIVEEKKKKPATGPEVAPQ